MMDGGKVWTKAGKTMCIVSNGGTNVIAEGHSRILSTFSRGLSSIREKRSFVLKSVHQSGKFLGMPAQNSELEKFPWEMSQSSLSRNFVLSSRRWLCG